MPTDRTILVVGAGQAALSLVTALRELGDDSPVVLVGAEPDPPYERPPLSKGYLAGRQDRAAIVLRPEDWYAEQGVELVTGEQVVDLTRHVDAAEGGLAVTSAGRRLPWHRLALTTGAEPTRLPVEGGDLGHVLSLRDVADADALSVALRAARSLVVVGGGFIGLEVAAAARALDVEVTVVEATARLMERAVSPAVSAFHAAAHRRRGTRVVLGATATRVHGSSGHAEAVVLDDGTELEADLVLVATGVRPRTGLARRLGLEVSPGGIVVDAEARASDGLTVAAGDCALGPNPYARGLPGPTRLESVPHASEQARAAAATLAGRPQPYASVPWFWSDQGDLRLQIAGLVAGADRFVVRGDPAAESFTVLAYRGGLLVAAESINATADHVAVRRALERGMTIDARVAADVGVPLRRSLVAPPDTATSPTS